MCNVIVMLMFELQKSKVSRPNMISLCHSEFSENVNKKRLFWTVTVQTVRTTQRKHSKPVLTFAKQWCIYLFSPPTRNKLLLWWGREGKYSLGAASLPKHQYQYRSLKPRSMCEPCHTLSHLCKYTQTHAPACTPIRRQPPQPQMCLHTGVGWLHFLIEWLEQFILTRRWIRGGI